MPETHLLCYIRRDRLTSWKLDSLDRGTRNHPVLAYGSDHTIFAKYAHPGNVIWVVGAYADGPPTLEAKIEIAREINTSKEYECEVSGTVGGSAFFGLNDASRPMMQLVFKSETSIWSLRDKYSTTHWQRVFGRDFQSPRRLADAGDRINGHRSLGAAPLEELEAISRRRSVFISWKHDDNKHRLRFMRALSIELAKRQFAVWWDKTALTNVDAIDEYRKQRKNELMNRLLHQGLSKSTVILALWTNNYGRRTNGNTPNWTRNEWHAKGQRSRFAITSDDIEFKREMCEPDEVFRMPHDPQPADAARLAREIAGSFRVSGQTLSRCSGEAEPRRVI